MKKRTTLIYMKQKYVFLFSTLYLRSYRIKLGAGEL